VVRVTGPSPVEKTVLIVSGTNDMHALAVRRELVAAGCTVHFFASDDFGAHELSFEFDREPYLRIAGERVNVGDISTIWWRRPSLNQRLPEAGFDDDQTDFVNRNCSRTLRSFLVASFSGVWVSSPDATDRAGDKLHQLQLAKERGFDVPDTLISNDPDAVRAFHERHGGNIIIKAAYNSRRLFLATQRVALDELSDDSIRAVPSIYQELIPGTKHLRVTCFGHHVSCALIETDELDWRPNLNVPITAYPLDPDLERRIVELLDAFDLKTGAMDLKISDRGDLVWFEVNPQGQFLFLEPLTGQGLLAGFVNFLLGE
jgi:glutathione synthase/RimK-type ligase-like ATP-grasp enzyme